MNRRDFLRRAAPAAAGVVASASAVEAAPRRLRTDNDLDEDGRPWRLDIRDEVDVLWSLHESVGGVYVNGEKIPFAIAFDRREGWVIHYTDNHNAIKRSRGIVHIEWKDAR